MKPLKEVLCCGQAVHKNNGMYMDKHQEIMHEIIFERSGKLPDGVIVSNIFANTSNLNHYALQTLCSVDVALLCRY